MAFDRFLIAPINTGLQTNLRPWLTMDDSFQLLDNCYVFRGRVTKRVGSLYMGDTQFTSRLRILIGTTDSSGDITAQIPGITVSSDYVPYLQGAIGQSFSIGDVWYTVVATGAPGTMIQSNATSSTATFDTTSGASATSGQVIIAGAAATTAVYWYPGLPVMGIDQYESGAINNHPSYAFDSIYAYKYNNGWDRSGTGGSPIWHEVDGDYDNYFWVANWEGLTDNAVAMFVTNFQVTNFNGLATSTDDPIWTTTDGTNWQKYYPIVTTLAGTPTTVTGFVVTARIIVAFKNRLVLLNTVENNNGSAVTVGVTDGSGNASGTVPGGTGAIGQYFVIGSQIYVVVSASGALSTSGGGAGTFNIATGAFTFTGATATTNILWYVSGQVGTNSNYSNRCRFSHNGSPFTQNAFLEPNVIYNNGAANVYADGAGFIDATTEEQIVSAEFIKDRLIVYFERSTWELAYIGNEVLPFVWQKINTELGSQSTFSTVPFDQQVLTIGNTGIHSCTGANVFRIDQKIPDEIFDFNSLQTDRTAGIRDYFAEVVYWSYVSDSAEPNQQFPNQVLIYNYQNESWATMDDCITAFGYFEQQQDTTWATAQGTWENYPGTWVDGILQANERQIIFGNSQGYILRMARDVSFNTPNMYITNLSSSNGITTLTIINHNLTDDPTLTAYDTDYIWIQGVSGDVTTEDALNGNIFEVNTVIDANTITILTGLTTSMYYGAGVAGRVSNVQILTKQFNPYVQKDRNVYLQRVDFCVLKTASGQITVDYYPSSSELSMIQEGIATDTLMGNSVLETSPYSPDYAPLESQQVRLWHPVYFQTSGEFIQLFLYFTDQQMRNQGISQVDFELEGLILYTQPVTDRLQ